ncbi:hypothetical protein ACTHGN_000287 [Pseudomonas putida]
MEKLKRLPITRRMMMANIPNAAEIAKSRMRRSVYYNADGETPFFVLASIVSSPRLFDVFWKDVPPDTFIKAGDTFVEQHTMLTDYQQKTYAISLADWSRLDGTYTEVEQYYDTDASISKIQVWPYDPRNLTFEQMVLSVGMSFTEEEFKEEPRLCGALRELMKDYKVEYYWEHRRYG